MGTSMRFLRPRKPGPYMGRRLLHQKLYGNAILLRMFYLFIFYYALTQIQMWGHLSEVQSIQPLWPAFWIQFLPNTGQAAQGIMALGFTTAFLALIAPQFRWVRIAVFLGLLQYLALRYSFGKIGHSMHLWLLVSFVFIFLPRGWTQIETLKPRSKISMLRVIHAAQVLVMLTYSMSGLGKIMGAIYQIFRGEIHAFHPDAMAYHIADRLLQTGSQSILGEFLIENRALTLPMMPLTIVIQTLALWVAFRPSLFKTWAIALILIHIGTSLTMTINFFPSIVLLALLFLFQKTK